MTDRLIQIIRSGLMACVIGIVGALLLSHWAACEQSDAVCMFTGSDSK